MKRLNKVLLVFVGLLFSFVACKDDSLQVVPEWETGVHTDITVTTGGQKEFFYKNPAPLTLDFLWNSVDSKLTVTKVEFFVQFNEPYIDKDNNPAYARHGGSAGLLIKTLEGAAVPANRTKTPVTFSQSDIYELYKNATFDYDADGTKTAVFANPDHPDRLADGRFVEADEFRLKWKVYTDDGRLFDSWSPSVCNEFPNAACQYDWVVICPYPGIAAFAGSYSANEPGYGDYDVTFTVKPGTTNTVINDNFWDVGESIEYVIDGVAGTVTIPEQTFSYGKVSGSGTINNCNGQMIVDYVVVGPFPDDNTHTFTKN